MRSQIGKIGSVLCLLVLVTTAFSGLTTNARTDSRNDEEEEHILPNLEDWHYRVPLIVDSGDYNRTDCILGQEINITKEIGGFGSFDNNSVRVIETNETGSPLWEVVFQFEWIDDSSIYVTWIMNGTAPAHTKRFYSIYFDILEYGPKTAPEYEEKFVESEENNEHIWIEGKYFDTDYYSIEEYEIKINKDRGGSREVKINNVPRKGFVYDHTWQSWHSDSLNWRIKGAETTIVGDGPIYKKIKIVSKDDKQTLYWYFYPDRMKIVFRGEGAISFDTIADNFLNIDGTLVWSDGSTANLTRMYEEYSKVTDFFYILDPKQKFDDRNREWKISSGKGKVSGEKAVGLDLSHRVDILPSVVKRLSGFWADTIDNVNQTVINAGKKGTRWILGGNEAWFGFAKNDKIRDIVIQSQNPPEISRERTWVILEEPMIEDAKIVEDKAVIVRGNVTITSTGNLIAINTAFIILGNVTIQHGGSFYITSSSAYLPQLPPIELPLPSPIIPPLLPFRSTTVAGNITIHGTLSVVKDTLSIASASCGENGLYIARNGSFNVSGSIVTAFNGTIWTAWTTQRFYSEKSYKFEIYGRAEIRNCDISKLWADPNALSIGGIQIYSNDVTIFGCNVYDSQGSGIFIPNNYMPRRTTTTVITTRTAIRTISMGLDGGANIVIVCFSVPEILNSVSVIETWIS